MRKDIRQLEDAVSAAVATVLLFAIVLSIISVSYTHLTLPTKA